jgi:REP element-mobilizing transposase RayT
MEKDPYAVTDRPMRRRLPHINRPGLTQFVTIRLHDSIPEETILRWKARVSESPSNPGTRLEYLLERYGDAGRGCCWLSRPEVANVVLDALLQEQPARHRLLSWCIMPNHVHAVLALQRHVGITEVIRDWKSRSARIANRLLGRVGTFWMPDFFDRAIRDDRHLAKAVEYVEQNPVKAGLVVRAGDWRWSSAWSSSSR